ncbi:integrase [Spirochaetia bacterium]|nr:integrase [Spirochaetia bacterium]
MMLDMHSKRKICNELFRRYQKAGKKGKKKLLDEYAKTLGYNRDYLAHLLANWGKTRYEVVDGKSVKYVAKDAPKARKMRLGGKKGGRPRKYGAEFAAVLYDIWEFFEWRCGKLFAPMLRLMIGFLVREYGLDDKTRSLLTQVSPATIDRLLAKEKAKLRLKGKSLTKPGKLLKNQIPVRVFFTWDERKPGFFEIDTVCHCGANSSGEFCCTLTITDVYSAWTEVFALRNRAHRWVKESIAGMAAALPFPLRGVDSDNGGEFINEQLLLWCNKNHVQFTRGRPYRKNDNCFVEQKNGDKVRKMIGPSRFDTDFEHAALAEAYRFLVPLINFWYPTLKLSGKEKQISGKYTKIYEKDPKTPCQRLLESPDVSQDSKAKLRSIAASLNPVELKKAFDKARDALLHFNRDKGNTLSTSA